MKAFLWTFAVLTAPALAEECETVLAASSAVRPPAVTALLVKQCGSCHRGPFLDFSKEPFFSDRFATEKALLEESLARARRADGKRMPPPSFPALSPEAIELLAAYVSALR